MKSLCPKCQGGAFELASVSPKGSTYVFRFVQCASCGAPAGVLEDLSISDAVNALHRDMQDKHQELAEKLDEVQRLLADLAK